MDSNQLLVPRPCEDTDRDTPPRRRMAAQISGLKKYQYFCIISWNVNDTDLKALSVTLSDLKALSQTHLKGLCSVARSLARLRALVLCDSTSIFYTRVAQSRSESTSQFTALALNKLSSSSSFSSFSFSSVAVMVRKFVLFFTS